MRRGERGFAFVWVLLVVAMVSVGLAALGPAWAENARREREAELLRVGMLYANAIAAYYHSPLGSVKRFPPSLQELEQDSRFIATRRYLRRLYPDPMRPGQQWAVMLGPDGTVRGVYSLSDAAPMRREALDLGQVKLPAAQRYSDWKFVPQVDS